jgi:phosphohistidine phosphatase
MLRLYLMRHGDAEPSRGKSDILLALTTRGITEAKTQAKRLGGSDHQITRILHSPYKRASQTALLVNEVLKLPMETCEHLVPGGSITRLLDTISGAEDHFLLVFHQPIIAEMALALTGQDMNFHPASIACLTRGNAFSRTAQLNWLQHP